MRLSRSVVCFTAMLLLVSCKAWNPYSSEADLALRPLTADLIASNSSSSAIDFESGAVLTDNDDGFEQKLALIKSATKSIDLAYYIFADDYSSSLLARELLAATARGVDVRMLLDYHRHYKALDYFLMLEEFGNRDAGSLTVKFYNRPSKNIVKDAVFMTLGCGQANAGERANCNAAKYRDIDALFAEEEIGGESVGSKNISNIRTENSGLFLSGLYSKNPSLMAMAVQRGQEVNIDSIKGGAADAGTGDLSKLKELGQLYWKANYGTGLDRLVNRLKLSAAFLLYGEQIDPVYDTFASFLPVDRSRSSELPAEAVEQARRDWNYVTDFLHHKILLVDRKYVMAGGRNIEDSYHMNPGPLAKKYAFMDTDIYLQLSDVDSDLTDSFDRLWQFDTMMASMDDVLAHAPNGFLVESSYASDACEHLTTADKSIHQSCIDEQLLVARARTLSVRLDDLFKQMNARADTYLDEYVVLDTGDRSRQFELDASAEIHYVENLPFRRSTSGLPTTRLYGARNGKEAVDSKHIHAVWQSALKRACDVASADNPQSIYLHNAYFLMPSNLLSQVAQMVDGRQPCAKVSIVVLTNSIETTDLNILNVFSRHSMKALFEHYAKNHDPSQGATLAYYEYIPRTNAANRSLHSKVMLFGDTLYIGSANTDFRSYLMDSNNGFLIQRAPDLIAAYTVWLRDILEDPDLTVMANDYFIQTDRGVMHDEDDRLVDATLAKYRAERFVDDPAKIAELKARLRAATDEAYRLSRAIVAHHGRSIDEQRRMNELFKMI